MNESNVLFYIPSERKDNKKIYSLVDKVSLIARTKIFENIDDLHRRLCQPAINPTIAVLLVFEKKDLLDIISIRHRLSDLPFILVLPDREKDMTSMGYALTPRFLTYMDNDLVEVESVLAKMLGNYQKKELRVEQGIMLM